MQCLQVQSGSEGGELASETLIRRGECTQTGQGHVKKKAQAGAPGTRWTGSALADGTLTLDLCPSGYESMSFSCPEVAGLWFFAMVALEHYTKL